MKRYRLNANRLARSAWESSSSGEAFKNQDIVIHLKKEEPVFETTVTQTGKIVARKQMQSQQENVQRQIRKDQIEVVKEGNPQNVTISKDVESVEGQGGGLIQYRWSKHGKRREGSPTSRSAINYPQDYQQQRNSPQSESTAGFLLPAKPASPPSLSRSVRTFSSRRSSLSSLSPPSG